MEGNVKTRRGPLAWMRKHKKLTALLLVILLVVVAVLVLRSRASNAASTMTYQYVRTTTLQKTDLTESVSVTGTVESGSEVSVTVDDANKAYKIKTIAVSVGDHVNEGDVIATLDTEELERKIESAQESYNETLSDSSDNLTQTTEDSASNIASLREAYEKAEWRYETLEITETYTDVQNEDGVTGTNRELVEYYYYKYNPQVESYNNQIASLTSSVKQAVADGSATLGQGDSVTEIMDSDSDEVKSWKQQIIDLENELTALKAKCNIPELGLYGYDTIAQYFSKIESYGEQRDQAEESYSNGLVSNSRKVEEAEENYSRAAEATDTLEEYQTQLENCTLTATMSGTVTALNATVGEACTGTVATIQDVDNLTVEVTIPTSDVSKLSTGLQCNITSDATDDETILGTLTRIDPVANAQGYFTATVTVNSQDSGLLIGISAQVEIIITSKADVFTVPIDAVGTADDGSSYVLRKTGGEGVDMTFEEVTVTTGDQNDYYIEITGDDLAEGDVIRSSADLTEGIESTTESTDDLSSLLGSLGGGDMGGDMGGGDMPSGGGDMPSGGGGGGGGAPGGM